MNFTYVRSVLSVADSTRQHPTNSLPGMLNVAPLILLFVPRRQPFIHGDASVTNSTEEGGSVTPTDETWATLCSSAPLPLLIVKTNTK